MKTIKKTSSLKVKFRIEDIIRIEADINYSHLILKSGKKIILARTLKAYEQSLALPFVRVNKSCMINLHYLMKKTAIENQKVKMNDGLEIHVSRRRVERVSKPIVSITH